MSPLFGFIGLGPVELCIVAVIGVLIFGRKLPEVGRYLGKGIVEFKKGIKGIEDDVDIGSSSSSNQQVDQPKAPQKMAASTPKFEDISSPSESSPKI